MAVYSEKELVYARALAEGLISDGSFRSWLTGLPELAEATHDPELQAARRSRTMKNPYWFNLWCGTCDRSNRHGCKIGTGIETDVFLIFETRDGRTGCHIEVKRRGDRLGDGQALSYPRRAACWSDPSRRPRTVPPHDRWRTILVHGDAQLTDAEATAFQRIVTHDDVAVRLPGYPE